MAEDFGVAAASAIEVARAFGKSAGGAKQRPAVGSRCLAQCAVRLRDYRHHRKSPGRGIPGAEPRRIALQPRITSIVELNQAQLSAIDAEIAYSRAKYDYFIARAVLDYEVGALDLTGTTR